MKYSFFMLRLVAPPLLANRGRSPWSRKWRDNEIDESYQDNLSEDELRSKTRIVEAIEKKAFFHEII